VGRPLVREDESVIYRGHSQQYMSAVFTVLLVDILHGQSVAKSPVPYGHLLFELRYICNSGVMR
jgi:hypothetical protein